MTEGRLESTSRSLLFALARRARVRALVYVTPAAAPHPYWISDEVGDAEETAALAEVGRRWLAGGGGGEQGGADEVAGADVHDRDDEPIGVLVAIKEPGAVWAAEERELLRFALRYFGPLLDERSRPAPFAPVHATTSQDVEVEAGIKDAIGRGELALVYQPEFDLLTREVTAVEALLRWRHPQRGELGPDSFLSLAERSGLITGIGAWVIDTSVAALASWTAALPGLDVVLRINVSPVQMTGTDLVELFRAAIERHGVAGGQLSIELTENAPLRDPAQVADTIRRLKRLGVTSAIDDLATGYSTLSQLRTLPVDIVKLDRSLITGIDRDPRAEAIVTALIGLALNFGLGVVAEGVETEDEAGALLRLGCTRAQGHHLGKPVPAAEVVGLLGARGMRAKQNT